MNTSYLKTTATSHAATVCAIALFAGALTAAGAGLKAGDAFPDLSQFKLEGKVPESLKGKVVLVDFWASWCAPCKKSFPALNDLQQRFGDKGVVIVAISVDEKRANIDSFLKGTPADFTVVRDAEQKLVAAVEVESMPTSFLLDRTGRVRFIHNGFSADSTAREYAKEIEELLKK